ncbi:MAG: hypothetical protein M3Z33_13220 [Actinomycetota bacterium]|nr:hypothetical protein [Actinomycetota bacterium]
MDESADRPGADQEQEQIPEGGEPKPPFGSDQDQKGAEGMDGEMGEGGYAGRDPATDMPRVPSVPESQDDPMSHDAAPEADKDREPGE